MQHSGFRDVVIASAAIVLLATIGSLVRGEGKGGEEKNGVRFYDARRQAAEFIGYYHSIQLTEGQKKTMQEALSVIPAPCCSDYSIATCCCPCNLAKSVWGLSHYLIAERGYDVPKVRALVREWMQFTNSRGYSGTACYRGGCTAPFGQDGCGGMNEKQIS